jgi:hypothetical protein
MFLLLSGEGASDIGTQDSQLGPMAKFVDKWIERRSGYSLIDRDYYKIVAKTRLVELIDELKSSNEFKPLSKVGKKKKRETTYFRNNARALAILAKRESLSHDTPIIPILFRDSDGTASSDRGEWEAKRLSMLAGFEAEGVSNGVPMIPKPKSEAWILCALRNKYQNCKKIENESGNDKSDDPLKRQLEECLGEKATRIFLNDQIDQGNLDVEKIVDMPSLTAFKDRLDEVLDNILGETRSLNSR